MNLDKDGQHDKEDGHEDTDSAGYQVSTKKRLTDKDSHDTIGKTLNSYNVCVENRAR